MKKTVRFAFILSLLSLMLIAGMQAAVAATLPEGLAVKEYALTAEDYNNGQVLYEAQIAFDGDDVYLGSFSFYSKGAWIKGTKDGNRLVFPEEQMVCVDEESGSEIYFYGVTVNGMGVSSSDFVLNYDAAADEYLAESGMMLTLGIPTAQLNYLEILENVLLSKTGRRIEHEVEFSKDIISATPEGELRQYCRSGFAYVNFYNNPTADTQEGMVLNMVYAPDGTTVYMQAPISGAGTTSWVKGYIEDGTLHVPLYQCIAKNGTNCAITGVCRWNRAHTYLEPYLNAKEITFSVDPETGVMTQNGDDAYVLLWSADFSWGKYADLQTVYTPFNETYTTIPEGLHTEQLALTYKNAESEVSRLVVTGALDPETGKYYIAGLAAADPDAAIVGTVEGNQIIFPSNQYMGSSSKCLSYFTAIKYTIRPEEFGGMIFYFSDHEYLDSLVLTMNEEKNGFAAAEGDGLMLHKGKANDYNIKNYYLTEYAPAFESYEEHASVPCDPRIISYTQDMAEGGYDRVQLLIKTEDVDGNFINPQRMAYQLFYRLGDYEAPYIFYADAYRIPEDMEIVPFIFSCRDNANATDIAVGGSVIYLYETGFDSIGVQVINYSGGVENRSNKIWWDYVKPDAVEAVTQTAAVPMQYYSVDGKLLDAPQRGLNIVRMSDGRVVKVKL